MTPDSASRATQTHARPTAEQCLDPSILPRLLCHDPETGKLYWLARTPDLFKCGRWTPCVREVVRRSTFSLFLRWAG